MAYILKSYLKHLMPRLGSPRLQGKHTFISKIKKPPEKSLSFLLTFKTALSLQVGCGVAGFQSGKWWKRLVACNYGAAGNWIGKPMYIKGDPCSKCQAGTKCTESLCA